MNTNSQPPSRRRIALVITELNVGGAERCLVNLAIGLKERQFEPAVFSVGPEPRLGRLVDRLADAGVPVNFLRATSAWQFGPTLLRLRRALKEFEPDLVQTFLFHANVLGLLAAKPIAPTPVVLGVRVADPTQWRKSWETRLARQAAAVVCVSQAVAAYMEEANPALADQLVVIPNGIDPFPYRDATPSSLEDLGISDDRRVILFVGRLHRQKGVDWLLEVGPSLLEPLPHHDLVLAGEGPRAEQLRKQAARGGIAGRVHFIGQRTDVPGLLKRSDLLVLPSRWEGMPNVILEAMAAARPVVATNCEGVAELLGPETAAQTVSFGDSKAFVKRVVALVHDDSLRQRVIESNAARVSREFSLDRMLDRYASLYDHLIGGGALGEKISENSRIWEP